MWFLITISIAGSWRKWWCRLLMSVGDVGWWRYWRLAFFFFCWWRRVSWRRIWIFSTSMNIPFSTLFLSFCYSALRFFLPISQEVFPSFLCLSRLTRRGLCSPVSLFSQSCAWLDLSPESFSMVKFFSGVQYGILMRLLKILKRRYLIYDDLSSFRISG